MDSNRSDPSTLTAITQIPVIDSYSNSYLNPPTSRELNDLHDKQLLQGRRVFILAWCDSSIDPYIQYFRDFFHHVMQGIYTTFERLGIDD